MEVAIKKLHKDAVIPEYAKAGDAGLDLTAVSVETTDDYYEYGTGLAMEIPRGYVGLIFPRSSISKKDLSLANSVAVIDSGYRGEIKLRFNALKPDWPMKIYEAGDRVGQLVVVPYPQVQLAEVEELSESDRGEGGFGSSGQ